MICSRLPCCRTSNEHFEPRTVTNRVHQLSLWLFATAAIFGLFTLLVPSVCAVYKLQSMSAVAQMSVMGSLGTLAALVGACATRSIAQVQKPPGLDQRNARRGDPTASPGASGGSPAPSRGSSGQSRPSTPTIPSTSAHTPHTSDDEADWVAVVSSDD